MGTPSDETSKRWSWQDGGVSLSRSLEPEARRLGLALESEVWDRIDVLLGLWEHYGRSINLLSMRSDAEAKNGVLEAFGAVSLAQQLGVSGRWLDVGSGGGFPGLVLAACCDAFSMTLVEPRARRAAFLERALGRLGRSDCGVVRARLEPGGVWRSLGESTVPRGPFVVVDSRAFVGLAEWLELADPLSEHWIFAHGRSGQPSPSGWTAANGVETPVGWVRAYECSAHRST